MLESKRDELQQPDGQGSATIVKFIQDQPPVALRALIREVLREALRRDDPAKIEAAIPERERES